MDVPPTGLWAPGADSGAARTSCGTLPPGCTPSELAPVIGSHVYCPAEHDWIPAMATAWSVTRHVAHDRCERWAVCPGIGRPCYHCASAGSEWGWWTGEWCDAR